MASSPSSFIKKPIPVLLMVRELGMGGIERDVAKLAIRLDRSRYLPHVATYKPEGARFDELQAAHVPILSLRFPSLLSGKALRAAQQFRSYIRKHQIQLVHAFDPSSVFAVPLARLLRVPVVLSSQLGHRELHDERTRKQLKMVDRLSDAVVVNCQSLQRHLVDDWKTDANRVLVCYNGVDTGVFYPKATPRPIELRSASLVIGTVCVLRPEKALALLLEAWARVRLFVPGSKLVIVGDGPEEKTLKRQAETLQLGDSCIFLPAASDVAPIFRAIDIFVLPSRSEAFSNALLEAMASGCCVLGSAVGGTPELIGTNEERGLLFQSGNVDDLAAKLARLISDFELRQSLAQAAVRFAHDSLKIEGNVARTMQIYDNLLGKSRRGAS